MSKTKFGLFFQHIAEGFKSIWQKEPAAEALILQINGAISKGIAESGTPQADIVAALFPNGAGNKTLAELKVLLPEALEVSTIGSDALKASEGIADPEAKLNAVITTVLTEAAKLPELQKEAHLLTIISGIVAHLLNISLVEATNLVTAKQIELQHVAA